MNKAARFWMLMLAVCVLFAAGFSAAYAEQVTVGITLTGMIPAGDGTYRTVTPEGSFRVYRNGQEVGTVAAGQDTLVLNSTDRIRIEPVPQSFAPEWDLRTAYLTPTLSGGTQMIEVTVYLLETAAGTPEATEVPAETPAPEVPEETENPDGAETAEETAGPAETQETAQQEAAATPTLPSYTAAEVTPEPETAGFPEGTGGGALRVQIFNDKNANGNQGNYEYGMKEITVYLLNEAEETVASAVTDADGFAVFENVPAGTYKTRVNLPKKWYFTQFGGENDLILNAYQSYPAGSQTSGPVVITDGTEAAQGIGIHDKATSMSGFCWLEEDVDGLYAEGEPRLAGITIRLSHQYEDITYETVTNEDGSWTIDHLHPGFYALSASAPDGLMLTRYTQSKGKRSFLTSDHPVRSVEAKDRDRSGMDIGFNWSAMISGRCYLDANYNGLYDEGEEPLKGVKLTARFTYDGAEAASAVSGEDGTYVLDGLRGNSYTIDAVLPEGGCVYTKTAPEEPLGNLFAARGDRRDQTVRNFVLADVERREMNIGAIYPATVSGTVYYDDNFSAEADQEEKKASGVLVRILDADGNVAASDKSNAAGVYELTGLTPGEYTLDVTAISGYAFTKTGAGNVILNRTGGKGYSEPFRVKLGGKVTGKDIGMIRPGTVKGTVFADRNDNGLRDEGEDGLEGVTVRLMDETEGEAFRAEIGEDGAFLFDAVMPGRYYLEYVLPDGAVFAQTAEDGNRITGDEQTGWTEPFDFVTGEVREAPLCGALTLGRIEGTVYQDHDGNGLLENEETMAGVAVKLTPSRKELEEVTAVTGADGSFVLPDLHPDTYQLEITCPEGYVVSRTDHLSLPLQAGKGTQAAALEVAMGAKRTGQQVGLVLPAALSGRLWLDENNNGLFDEGERMPAGYRIHVTDETTGTLFDMPVTDEDGTYSVTGMIPGSYTVSLPLDDRTLAPKAGDSMFSEVNGSLTLSGIRLEENGTLDGLLAGIVRYTEISGHAWIDRGEGTEDLEGVKIVMKDPAGNVIAETETDSNGSYRLSRLMPTAFTLEVTAPEGCVIIEPGDPRLTGNTRSVVTRPSNRLGTTEERILLMDQDLQQMDIGCVLPGRLGDYCWLDLNGDGLQGSDEPGIPNVRIELLRDGVTVAETTTDQYGFYRFVDLYPAAYTLWVTAPDEVKPTVRRTDLPIIASVLEETDGSVAFSVPLTVESNRSDYNADLGFVCRVDGVMPAGCGEGETQDWTPKY